jgi:hypothetical protein
MVSTAGATTRYWRKTAARGEHDEIGYRDEAAAEGRCPVWNVRPAAVRPHQDRPRRTRLRFWLSIRAARLPHPSFTPARLPDSRIRAGRRAEGGRNADPRSCRQRATAIGRRAPPGRARAACRLAVRAGRLRPGVPRGNAAHRRRPSSLARHTNDHLDRRACRGGHLALAALPGCSPPMPGRLRPG